MMRARGMRVRRNGFNGGAPFAVSAGSSAFVALRLMSIRNPPQTVNIQKTPPAPPGEKKVASAKFVPSRMEKRVKVAV